MNSPHDTRSLHDTRRQIAEMLAEKIENCTVPDVLYLHNSLLFALQRVVRKGAYVSLRWSAGRRVWSVGTHPKDNRPTLATDDGLLTV